MSKWLLHLEGFTVLLLSICFYSYLQFNWVIFLILLFTPDLSALGYLINVKVGSIVYNLFHTYTFPAVILSIGFIVHNNLAVMLSLIWIAHIGMDRMFGYGLKYPTTFKDTHLNRV